MSWHVYLIECEDGSIYTGIAVDVAKRYAAHCAGKGAKYTRARKPRQLLASFEVANRSEATKLEGLIKKLPSKTKRNLASGAAENICSTLLVMVSDGG
ncbi:MAG: GIY-YIG nuclease family protein [Permianibacter sp.]